MHDDIHTHTSYMHIHFTYNLYSHNHIHTHICTCKQTLITLWQLEGEKVEAVAGFIFLDFKITADRDCIHEI